MDTIKSKIIECLINSDIKMKPIKTKDSYKVKLNITTEFEVKDIVIETVQLIQSGTRLLSPSLKRSFNNNQGVIHVENLGNSIDFYSNSNDNIEALNSVLKCIKQDYNDSVAKYKETKVLRHAQNANNLVKLYNSFKTAYAKKGVA